MFVPALVRARTGFKGKISSVAYSMGPKNDLEEGESLEEAATYFH
jgi:hypothetical protein